MPTCDEYHSAAAIATAAAAAAATTKNWFRSNFYYMDCGMWLWFSVAKPQKLWQNENVRWKIVGGINNWAGTAYGTHLLLFPLFLLTFSLTSPTPPLFLYDLRAQLQIISNRIMSTSTGIPFNTHQERDREKGKYVIMDIMMLIDIKFLSLLLLLLRKIDMEPPASVWLVVMLKSV